MYANEVNFLYSPSCQDAVVFSLQHFVVLTNQFGLKPNFSTKIKKKKIFENLNFTFKNQILEKWAQIQTVTVQFHTI